MIDTPSERKTGGVLSDPLYALMRERD